MKTLKKTLCLVLAVVMVVGVLILPVGADYDDADKIEHKEAAAVLDGLGIMEGDEGGFRPNDTLSRAEAAKIIVYLFEGPTAAAAYDEPVVTGFSDVDALDDYWASGYIGYCVDKGIIGGYGDGTFGFDDPLTGAAFAKMLLCGLGYNAETEGFTGVGFEGKVATAARNSKTQLTADLAGLRIDSVTPITRDQAAAMAFNALTKAKTVEYEGGFNFSSGDTSITTGGSKNYSDTAFCDVSGIGDYATLEPVTAAANTETDAFKRPEGAGWKLNNKVIYAADLTPVVVPLGANADALKDYDCTNVSKYYVDGKDESTSLGISPAKTAEGIVGLKKANNVVELYLAADGKTVETIVVVNTYAGKVEVVPASGNNKRQIKITGAISTKTVANLETESYADGDVIIFNATTTDGNTYTVVEHEAATKVEGTLTSYTSGGDYTVNGTSLKLSGSLVNDFDATALQGLLGKACNYYTDAAGAIVYAAEPNNVTAPITNYAMIVGIDVAITNAVFPATGSVVTVRVQAVLSDGTTGIFEMKTVDNEKEKAIEVVGQGKVNVTKTNGTVKADTISLDDIYTYSVTNGVITLGKLTAFAGSETTSGATLASPTSNLKNELTFKANSKDIIQNNKTVYISYEKKADGSVSVNKVEGVANLTVDSDGYETSKVKAVVDVTSDGKDANNNVNVASVVFINGALENTTAGVDAGNYVYVTGNYTTSIDGNKTIYTYEIINADGTIGTATLTGDTNAELKGAPGAYQLKTDGTIEKTNGAKTNNENVKSVSGNVVGIGENFYDVTDAVIIDATGKGKTALEKDMKVIVIANNSVASLIFIVG